MLWPLLFCASSFASYYHLLD
jgi:hypothetical protein